MAHPEQEKFQAAYDLYIDRPTQENGVILRRYVGDWIGTRDVAMLGPSLAIFEILLDRGHFGKTWWKHFLGKQTLKLLRHHLKDDRPGWNDYFMCRWQLTRDNEAAKEIHRRAAHIQPASEEWSMVAFTAKWMADSQRSQDPGFDVVMKHIEQTCELCRS
jgi:hypothetical protein